MPGLRPPSSSRLDPKRTSESRIVMRQFLSALALTAALLPGCSGPATPSANPTLGGSQKILPSTSSLQKPALLTFDANNDTLAYWHVQRNGSMKLQSISGSLGISNVYALAADGDTVIVANYSPAEIVTYKLDTQTEATMSDPYGGPVDVAVDRHGNIYALNLADVVVYKAGSSKPTELTCSSIDVGEAIAVNNEGDVFVDGYGPDGSFQGVVEYPKGSGTCSIPHLRKSRGYIAGVGVDPKTDDLIVVDDPDYCAGGLEGRMVIYPKPYDQRTSRRRVLSATYCAGTFRLDGDSTRIFYSDATVSDGLPIIDQARYPSGKFEGQYWLGYYSSVYFSGITTIPNTLPN
jgi:hypothetical protein